MVNGRTLGILLLTGATCAILNCGQKPLQKPQVGQEDIPKRTLEETAQVPVQSVPQQPMLQAQLPYLDTNSLPSQENINATPSLGYPQVPILGFSANPEGSGPFQYQQGFILSGKEFEAFFTGARIETFSQYFLEMQRHIRDSIGQSLHFDRQGFESLSQRLDYRNRLDAFLFATFIFYLSNPGKKEVNFGDFSILQGNRRIPIYSPNNIIPGGMSGPTYGEIIFDAGNQTIAGARSIPVSDRQGVLVTLPFRIGHKPLSVYDLDPESYDICRIVDEKGQGFDVGRIKQMINEPRLQNSQVR